MSKLTLENWESARGERARRPRGPKPVARGQLLRATAWLDGDLTWHDGALNWKVGAQTIVADASQIERTGRALDKLEARGIEGAAVALRRLKWRLARKLGALEARDLDRLCAVSRRRNPAALGRLAPLLALESLGVELPHSPARALLRAWPHGRDALESIVLDEEWPAGARELAAFLVGAAQASAIADLPKPLRGIAALGARLGEQTQEFERPALLLRAARQSETMAFRLVELGASEAPFAPVAAALQRLARAYEIEGALEIGEQLAGIGEVWPQLPAFPVANDAESAYLWHEAQVTWRRARRDWTAQCREIMPVLAARDASAVAAFVELAGALLGAALCAIAPPKKRGKRRKAPAVSVEPAFFAAHATDELGKWSLRLARQALQSPDVAATLKLWALVIGQHLAKASAPHPRNSPDRAASVRWVRSLRRAVAHDALPLLRVARAGGYEVACQAWQRGKYRELGNTWSRDAGERWPARAVLESWAQLVREAPTLEMSPWSWQEIWRQFEPSRAQRTAAELLGCARSVAPATRAHIIEGLQWWSPTRDEGHAVWPHIPTLLRAVAPTIGGWENRVSGAVDALCQGAAICYRANLAPLTWPLVAHSALEVCAPLVGDADKECGSWDYAYFVALRLCLSDATADETETEWTAARDGEFRATFAALLGLLPDKHGQLENAAPGARVARGRPQLAGALRDGLQVAPARALRALEHVAALRNLHQLDALQILETPAPELDAQWLLITQVSPAVEPFARSYAAWQTLAGQSSEPPPGALKIVGWPHKWAREIEALQNRVADNPQLGDRLDNLRARLADEPKWRAQQNAELTQLLQNATKRAAFAAVERAIEGAFRARLENLCGELPAEFAFDDDWFNALLLGSDIEHNRKWARQLLRHEVAGARDWREQLPGNARFLKSLEQRGVDTGFYRSEFGRARGELWLWIETAPLGILQMGNRFNTCLSRGGCNAFAGVANAIELNKRVVYARDCKGHIVARQLWAVNAQWALVGFDVYSTLAGAERAGLEAHFAAHAREFARSCGLELADAGEVESLVAPQWYDDGVRAWEAQSVARASKAG